MVQYHALGVLYHIKQKDRIAVSKLVISQMKSASLRSPYATCLLIRYVSKVMETESDNATMYVVLACICDRLPIHLRVLAAGARKRNTAHISRALRPGPRMVTSLAALFVSLFLSPLPPSVQPLAIPSPTLSPPSPPSQPLQPLSLSSLSSLSLSLSLFLSFCLSLSVCLSLSHSLSPPPLPPSLVRALLNLAGTSSSSHASATRARWSSTRPPGRSSTSRTSALASSHRPSRCCSSS